MSDKSKHQRRVEEFMEKADQEVPGVPTIPDENTRILRAKLILEEAMETIEALGVTLTASIENSECVEFDHFKFNTNKNFNMVKVIDGCCDLSVVNTGTLSACGVEDKPVIKAVDKANLRKFGPGGHRRDDGKWIKPKDFVGPEKDIKKYLAKFKDD